MTLYYDVWLGASGLVMLARVHGHERNPSYTVWDCETIGM